MGRKKKTRAVGTKRGRVKIRPEDHWGLVYTVARRYQHRGVELEDLAQEGMLGVLRAIETYDPAKGAFTTYAMQWIWHHVARCVDNLSRLVRIPIHKLDKMRKAGEVQPAPASFDKVIKHETGSDFTLYDVMPTDSPSPEAVLAEKQERAVVRQEVGKLTSRERMVLRMRFEEEKTLSEIGEVFGLTRERIRQIEAKALLRLRPRLERAL